MPLVLSDTPAREHSRRSDRDALLEGIRDMGLDCLPWSREATEWRQRAGVFIRPPGSGLDVSDSALLETLEDWLLPYLAGMSRLDHLKSLDMLAILKSRLDWSDLQTLEKQVPSHSPFPAGPASG